jgi:hypothetical protein
VLVGTGVSVGTGVAVLVGNRVGVNVGCGVSVSTGRSVAVGTSVAVGRGVFVITGVGVAVAVGVSTTNSVGVAVGIAVWVGSGVGVTVGISDVALGVDRIDCCGAVAVACGSGVYVGVGSRDTVSVKRGAAACAREVATGVNMTSDVGVVTGNTVLAVAEGVTVGVRVGVRVGTGVRVSWGVVTALPLDEPPEFTGRSIDGSAAMLTASPGGVNVGVACRLATVAVDSTGSVPAVAVTAGWPGARISSAVAGAVLAWAMICTPVAVGVSVITMAMACSWSTISAVAKGSAKTEATTVSGPLFTVCSCI